MLRGQPVSRVNEGRAWVDPSPCPPNDSTGARGWHQRPLAGISDVGNDDLTD